MDRKLERLAELLEARRRARMVMAELSSCETHPNAAMFSALAAEAEFSANSAVQHYRNALLNQSLTTRDYMADDKAGGHA